MARLKHAIPKYFLMTARVYQFDEEFEAERNKLYFYEPSIRCQAFDDIDAANAAAARLLLPESAFDFSSSALQVPPEVFCKWFESRTSTPDLSDDLAILYRVAGGAHGLMLLREVVSGKPNPPVAARVVARVTQDDRWGRGMWKWTKDRTSVSARTIAGELLPSDMSWVEPGFPFFEMLETSSLE